MGAVAATLLAAAGTTHGGSGPRDASALASPTRSRQFGGPVAAGASRAVRSLPDLGSVTPPTGAAARLGSAADHAPGPTTAAAPVAAAGAGPRGAGSVGPDAAGRSPVSSSSLGPVPTPPASSTSAGLPVSPAAVAPLPDIADPAERFERELERHASASRPTPGRLPHRFEPMARALLPGTARARVSSDEASRSALASVGKLAATVGDVIHLAQPLDATPRSAEIVAHELTHVASPSPAPRFFADDRDSPEERRARAVGRAMAQAPVGSPPVAPAPAGSGPAGVPAGSGAPPAGANGGSRPAGSSTRPAGSTGSSSTAGASTTGTRIPGGSSGHAGHAGTAGSPSAGVGNPASPNGVSTTGLSDAGSLDVERLLDALEARVLRELERRGRRWPRMI